MKIIGQYDTSGNYNPYITPSEVVQIGDQLRQKDDGFVLGIMDNYGDWVSPNLMQFGLKSKLEVTP